MGAERRPDNPSDLSGTDMSKPIWLAPNIGTLPAFMTADECADYIRLGEDIGYE